MSCSADTVPAAVELRAAASRLLGLDLDDATPAGGGGNSRIYRLWAASGSYALKRYPNDQRDRLGREYGALSFLAREGIGEVPKPITSDAASGIGIYEWIDGARIDRMTARDIEDFLRFIGRVNRLRGTVGAGELPAASAACLSPAALIVQLRERRARLRRAARQAGTLDRFLSEFDGALHHFAAAAIDHLDAARIPFESELPPSLRCLSPSDFGAHNALRRADGKLVFVDFEYFGWDDPAKLAADVLLHPGHSLSPALRRRFAAGMRGLFGDADPAFSVRLAALYPLYGLCWCLILLNPFLPGGGGASAEKRSAQLARARVMLDDLRARHDYGAAA